MYKVMLADDEGIVIDSLTYIIRQNFDGECQVESAKTGRSVIELAESFRPDIAFMDIQMPGINGIEAMKEIKKNNPNLIFIVMSAYDKFDYAQEAINLGVLEYLHKPVNQKKIVEVLKRAITDICWWTIEGKSAAGIWRQRKSWRSWFRCWSRALSWQAFCRPRTGRGLKITKAFSA